MKLVYANGTPVRVGDSVSTFRGESAQVIGVSHPTHAGSTGRVQLRMTKGGEQREFFPSVINARWVED